MADAWFPKDYCDEVMPDDRESANAWLIKTASGTICIDAPTPWDGEPIPLSDGEIVKFSTRTDYGRAKLTFASDGSWTVDHPMPKDAQQVCAMLGWQSETLSKSVEGVVDLLREIGEADGEFVLAYYTFADAPDQRFDAATQSFVEVKAFR